MVDTTQVKALIDDITTQVDNELKSISDDIVLSYTRDLDDIMRNINTEIICNDNASDSVLEKYFLELSNALFFIASKGEFLGLYADMSDVNYKKTYNDAYCDKQLNAAKEGKKTTQNDNTIFAENNSINELVVNKIYTRSVRVVKTKIDSANEMLKTLSKIISKRMSEKDYSNFTKTSQDNNDSPF